MTVREPAWTDNDRALVRALLDYRANTCPLCGRQSEVCQDPSTAQTWQVISHICEPSRIAQAKAETAGRGELFATRRTPGVV